MRIGKNGRWFIRLDRYLLRIQLGGIGIYISRIRLQPKGTAKKDFRLRLLERDGFRCRQCGRRLTDSTLTIHHVKPKSLYPELKRDPSNCVCLCGECHTELHRQEDMRLAQQLRQARASMHLTVSVLPTAPTLYEKSQGNPA